MNNLLLNKRRFLGGLSLIFVFALVSCVNTSSSSSVNDGESSILSSEQTTVPDSEHGSSEAPSGSEEPAMTNKTFSTARFTDPLRDDRPMVMAHAMSRPVVDDAFSRGYGGIVTNVAWGQDYLQNARAFTNLRSSLNYAIGKGMYIWLYDELGYPSGAAFGQTLKDNPEYEALGLVSQNRVVAPGASVTVNLLYGHNAIEEAHVFDGNHVDTMDISSRATVSHLINEAKNQIVYQNNTNSSKVLLTFESKRWYEHTHSMENWYAQQRYINMLERDPTTKFINLTHEQYYEYLSAEFGKGIKAFFTDEPAHQGNYFDITDRPRTVLDVPDLDVPIHPSLNYADTLFTQFNEVYGYELEPYLSYLYHDDGSTLGKQIRMDFYALTSELFRVNYLEQIDDWTTAHGVKSSGHLLLEEFLHQNPWFAGNMIQLLGTMGIPGTDMLFSRPVRAMKDSSIVSRMASSAADFLQKPDTFAEVSGAFDGNRGTVAERANAIGVQVTMGINNFSSYYYQGNDHSLEEDLFFSSAVGRMRYMVTESLHRANVAVYYPYEGVSAVTLPSTSMHVATEEAHLMNDEFRDVVNTLVEKQIDYDLIDHQNLALTEIVDGALVTPNGERFTTVIVPYTAALYASTITKLHEAADAGVKIIIQDFDTVVAERGQNSVATLFPSLVAKATNLRTSVSIANYIRNNDLNTFKVDDAYANDIYMSKRENTNYYVYPTVNAGTRNKALNFTMEANGSAVKYYNAFTGEISEIDATFANNKVTFAFTVPANTTGFFVIEK